MLFALHRDSKEHFNMVICHDVTCWIDSVLLVWLVETNMGHKVELGANWIHGIDLNPIYKIAISNNLLSNQYAGRHLDKKMMFVTESGEPVNARIVQDVDLNYWMLMSECEDFYKQQLPTPVDGDSVGAYVEREFEERIRRYWFPGRLYSSQTFTL